MRKIFSLSLVALMILPACSSVQVYDNKKMASQLTAATTSAAQELQNAQQEYSRQEKVCDHLKKRSPKGLDQFVSRLHSLKLALDQLKSRERSLREGSAGFSSYAHTHPRVFSTDEGYRENVSTVQDLEHRVEDFNRGLAQFSASAQDLRLWLKQSGLYQASKTQDLADEMQKDDQSWRAAYNQMVANYNQAKEDFENWQVRRPAESAQRAEKMGRILKALHFKLGEMNDLLARHSQMHQSYLDIFAIHPVVSNLDSLFPKFNQFKSDNDRLKIDFQMKLTQASRTYDDYLAMRKSDS